MNMTDEQYFTELWNSEKVNKPNYKQDYIVWIQRNYPISNGKMLLERMEDLQTQLSFIKDNDLPDDVELI